MNTPLTLDIETIPLEGALAAPYPAARRDPPSNYKSDEAIAKWRTADEARWREERAKECSLNPRLGRILVIGTDREMLVAPSASDEPEVLARAWDLLAEHGYRVVTWNGSWDLRFLLLRSMRHGIALPAAAQPWVAQWFKRYSYSPHFDCKAVLLNWEVRVSGEGLTEWAEFLGLPGKLGGLSGADVWPLYQAGHIEEIVEYCQQDVAATRAVFDKVSPYFFGDA